MKNSIFCIGVYTCTYLISVMCSENSRVWKIHVLDKISFTENCVLKIHMFDQSIAF